jgi:hypothetical protein
VLVLLNFSAEPAAVRLTLPEEFRSLGNGGLVDRLNEEEIHFIGTNAIQVNPVSARILTAKEA